MNTNTEQTAESIWSDDKLDRQQYSSFLTGYLDSKCGPDQPALVLALDAPWGLGKTFFVQRWVATLRLEDRPVIAFDAWENDSAEDPAISFMSELLKDLGPLYKKVPLGDVAKQQLKEKSKELVVNLRKATLPALAVVGKGMLKKISGVAADELIDSFSGVDTELDAFDEMADAAPQVIEAGLNKFFEKSLQSHTERLRSVKAFRKSLEEMLAILHSHGLAKGPLYVFIDELDRCRPDYAIRLLEGVKHLFSAKGVVFVISTNLTQLSKAVGAVYGPSFDGYSYLKRFFDFEFQLPEPQRFAFIKLLLSTSNLERFNVLGFDPSLSEQEKTVAHAFASIADSFGLDLRAIQRIVTIADAAVSRIPTNANLLPHWLFFLSTLRHLSPDDFTAVSNRTLNFQEFGSLCKRVFNGPGAISALARSENGPSDQRIAVSTAEVMTLIYQSIGMSARDLRSTVDSLGDEYWRIQYPNILQMDLHQRWNYTNSRQHPLLAYSDLVSSAGFISKVLQG